MSNTSLTSAIEEWRTTLGIHNVITENDGIARYLSDTNGYSRYIPAALRISNPEILQEALKTATRHRTPIYPISTGHNWGYGTSLPARDGCVLLDLSGMNRILHFDAELGVVTVEPGVTQGMLADFLERGGHEFLVPVTGAGPSCSLLANALERGYGVTPYTDHFGAVTDLEAVLPDGSLYRTALREAGSEELARLFKWGIGPYSAGLFTQSGFGVVTRVSIALARRPECVKVCLFSLKSDDLLEPAILAIRSCLSRLQGTMGGINLMNQHRVLSMSAPYPSDQLDPQGMIPPAVLQALGRKFQIFPWTGFATLYGTRRMVRAAQHEIRALLGGLSTRMMFLSPGNAQMLAQMTQLIPGNWGKGLQGMTSTLAKSLELVAGRPNETTLPLAYWRNPKGIPAHDDPLNPAADGCGLMWYAPLVPMRPQDVRAYVNMVQEVTPRFGLEPLITFTSLGDRLFDSTVPLVFDRGQPEQVSAAAQCYQDLLLRGKTHGWFPYRVGINTMNTLLEMQDHAKTFHERLRKDLDPHDILSPGRYR